MARIKFPWAPTGSTTFNRVQGYAYARPGTLVKMSGKGTPAGVFKTGPFKLGGR